MKTFDIISFGSATKDIFLRSSHFLVGDFKKDHIKKEILLPFGHKVEIKEIHFHSGGGGTNAAATFSSQKLKTAYCGTVGKDLEGKDVLNELKRKNICTDFVLRTGKKPTNLSVIFSSPEERTILFYTGASGIMNKKEINWKGIKKSKWFYLAPSSGEINIIFKDILDFAKKNKIKVMANLGVSQLKMPLNILRKSLSMIDVLIFNQEEAQDLIKNRSLTGKKLIMKIREIFSGIIILTNGEDEVFVSAEGFIYSSLPIKTKILDKTGAGDAFGSGFLAGYIKSKGDISYAVQLAVANSASCLKKWGAKEGLLRAGQKFKRVKIKIEKCL